MCTCTFLFFSIHKQHARTMPVYTCLTRTAESQWIGGAHSAIHKQHVYYRYQVQVRCRSTIVDTCTTQRGIRPRPELAAFIASDACCDCASLALCPPPRFFRIAGESEFHAPSRDGGEQCWVEHVQSDVLANLQGKSLSVPQSHRTKRQVSKRLIIQLCVRVMSQWPKHKLLKICLPRQQEACLMQ